MPIIVPVALRAKRTAGKATRKAQVQAQAAAPALSLEAQFALVRTEVQRLWHACVKAYRHFESHSLSSEAHTKYKALDLAYQRAVLEERRLRYEMKLYDPYGPAYAATREGRAILTPWKAREARKEDSP
jgi:hypothetical protein